MGRPLKSEGQFLRAYVLYRAGFKFPKSIHQALQKEFDESEEVVSYETVKKWIDHFKTVNPVTIDLDSPFEWHRLEEYNLPWEASPYLMQMWRTVRMDMLTWELPKLANPTVRQVLWWWRVHLAAPDVAMADVWSLAQRFVSRELRRDLRGEPLDLADLEAHLIYRPWEGWPDDQTSLQDYRRGVAARTIPPLKLTDVRALRWPDVPDGALTSVALIRLLPPFIHPEYPELLPSQQWRLIIEERRKETKDQ